MAQIKFFRGEDASALPSTKTDGAIYILESAMQDPALETGYANGEMYVDISADTRLRIDNNCSVVKLTRTQLSNFSSTISPLGQVYLIVENNLDENNQYIPVGFKVGDGSNYITNLQTFPILTDEERSKIVTLETNITTLQGDVGTLESDVDTLQTNVSTLQSNIINRNNVGVSGETLNIDPIISS